MGVTDLEFLALKIRDPVRAVIATISRPPDYNTVDFITNLRNLLEAVEMMDVDHVIVCGDFNEDMSSSRRPINDHFTNRGYKQLV